MRKFGWDRIYKNWMELGRWRKLDYYCLIDYLLMLTFIIAAREIWCIFFKFGKSGFANIDTHITHYITPFFILRALTISGWNSFRWQVMRERGESPASSGLKDGLSSFRKWKIPASTFHFKSIENLIFWKYFLNKLHHFWN